MPLNISIVLATVNSNSLVVEMTMYFYCKVFSKLLRKIIALRKEDLPRIDVKYPLFPGYVLHFYLLWYVPVVLSLF